MKRRVLSCLLVCLALIHFASTSFAQTSAPDLDTYVARVLKEFEVPGLAVAIVKDGKTVLTKGYGVRKLGEPTPVDEHTLFGIASNTKAFTAAALAILVDEGKIGWDDPVTKHLPNFQMYDPYVTRELTIRDLLTHRSGLGLGAGRYNDTWYGEATITIENSKPVLRFGHTPGMVADLEHWQYDTFVARWRNRSLSADAFVYFALKPDGNIEHMKMQAVSPLTDFSFDFQDLLFVPAPAETRR